MEDQPPENPEPKRPARIIRFVAPPLRDEKGLPAVAVLDAEANVLLVDSTILDQLSEHEQRLVIHTRDNLYDI